jgi:integrase
VAYVRPLKNGKFRAEVERKGVRKTAVWDTEPLATTWAKKVEAEILAGNTAAGHTFTEAAERYMQDVSSGKRGKRWEDLRIPKMIGHFGGKSLAELSAPDIAGWRDARLKLVSASTVLRESKLLHNIFKIARLEWHWLDTDPFTGVKMPKHDPARHQRWGWREIRRVLRYLDYVTGQPPQTKQQEVALAFLISLRTALRAGEVLQVVPGALSGRVLTLPTTKTEKRAQVPLTRQGARLCRSVKGWTIDSSSLDALFRKARDNTLVGDLRFHDARATALTMLARKVDVLVLSRISRHKNLKMLSEVYYRATAAEIAEGL